MSRFSFVAALTLAVVVGAAAAAPVSGTLTFFGDATLTPTSQTFLCDILPAMPCPAGTGAANVSGAVSLSGDFTALANTNAYVANLNENVMPIGQVFALPNAITFKANPGFVFDLTKIFAGTGGPCPPVGAGTCTPAVPALVSASNPSGLSIYDMTNIAGGSLLSFRVAGNARRLSGGETSAFNGMFTFDFTSTPGTSDSDVAHIISDWATAGSITSSYTAVFVVAPPTSKNVPEPSSILMLAAGIAGLRLGRRGGKDAARQAAKPRG